MIFIDPGLNHMFFVKLLLWPSSCQTFPSSVALSYASPVWHGCVAACMDISGLISCLGCQGSASLCNRFAVQYDAVIVISSLLGVVIPCQAVSLYSKLSCLGHQGPAISCTRYGSLLILVVWLYYLV